MHSMAQVHSPLIFASAYIERMVGSGRRGPSQVSTFKGLLAWYLRACLRSRAMRRSSAWKRSGSSGASVIKVENVMRGLTVPSSSCSLSDALGQWRCCWRSRLVASYRWPAVMPPGASMCMGEALGAWKPSSPVASLPNSLGFEAPSSSLSLAQTASPRTAAQQEHRQRGPSSS